MERIYSFMLPQMYLISGKLNLVDFMEKLCFVTEPLWSEIGTIKHLFELWVDIELPSTEVPQQPKRESRPGSVSKRMFHTFTATNVAAKANQTVHRAKRNIEKRKDQLVPLWHQHESPYSMSCKLTVLWLLCLSEECNHLPCDLIPQGGCNSWRQRSQRFVQRMRHWEIAG